MSFRSLANAPAQANLAAPSRALPIWVVFIYVGALAFVEWLLAVSVPTAAVGFGLLPLLLCLALLLPLNKDSLALLTILIAIPVVRLVVVTAPTADVTPLIRLGMVAVPAWIVVGLTARSCPTAWRLLRPGPGGWRALGAVTATGIPLGVVVYLVAKPMVVTEASLPVIAAGALLAFAVVPDEFLFRGLLVPGMGCVVGRDAVPLSATAYAATFVAYGSLPVVVTAFGTGYVLGWLRQRTGSASGVIGARIVSVLLACLVLPTIAV